MCAVSRGDDGGIHVDYMGMLWYFKTAERVTVV